MSYMAPELKQHLKSGTMPLKFRDKQLNFKQDIYSLGLILYELCHSIKSEAQKAMLFKNLGEDRQLAPSCFLVPGEHIEYELILKMTERDPRLRPSCFEVKNEWLPKWQAQVDSSLLI